MSFGDKFRIEDLNGNELAYIEQEVFRFLPEYNIYSSGQHLAQVKKELTFFKPNFRISSSYGDYQMYGDFFAHEFQIIKNGIVVATVSKKWFSFSDTYMVDIRNEENHPFILALVIVVDQVLHDNEDSN